jgi:hypothetical protein
VLEDGTKALVAGRADGARIARLGDVELSFARWSPDGARVAFTSGRWPKSAVYLMDADGTGLRTLVN